MSSLLGDLIIWALLFIGAVFCGIGLMGLLLFPDTRSRMFTAFRATCIGLGAVALAAITYAYTMSLTAGNDLYLALILRTLFLVFVLTAGTTVMYKNIRERTSGKKSGCTGQQPAGPETDMEDGE